LAEHSANWLFLITFQPIIDNLAKLAQVEPFFWLNSENIFTWGFYRWSDCCKRNIFYDALKTSEIQMELIVDKFEFFFLELRGIFRNNMDF
jgi:hypothetical protein